MEEKLVLLLSMLTIVKYLVVYTEVKRYKRRVELERALDAWVHQMCKAFAGCNPDSPLHLCGRYINMNEETRTWIKSRSQARTTR